MGHLSFVPALLLSVLMPLFLPTSYAYLSYFILAEHSHAQLFGYTILPEFPISHSHTEWYLIFSPFGARETK